jgi:hypothetical protein
MFGLLDVRSIENPAIISYTPYTTLPPSLTAAQPSTGPLPCGCIPRAATPFDFMQHISYVTTPPLALLCKNLLIHQKISVLNLDLKSI